MSHSTLRLVVLIHEGELQAPFIVDRFKTGDLLLQINAGLSQTGSYHLNPGGQLLDLFHLFTQPLIVLESLGDFIYSFVG